MSFHERKTCRLCLSDQLHSVLKLPDTPLANEFVTTKQEQKKYPLEIVQCRTCGHSQLRHVFDPKLLFTNYAYASGTSPSFVKHFEEYATTVVNSLFNKNDLRREPPERYPFVVEIGSNDGTLLKTFKKLGWNVLGIEPAKNLFEASVANGVVPVTAFFTKALATETAAVYGAADAVAANNVLAHIDDLDDVMRGVKTLLAPDGVFVFEVQYLGDLLTGGMFDLCYGEHLDYHAVAPLLGFFHRHELVLSHVDHVPTHGGSIRCWVRRFGLSDESVDACVVAERLQGVLDGTGWAALADKIESTKRELRTVIDTFKARDANIVAYGAPAKLTTFIYTLGLTADDIDYVVDDSPLKQGKYTPGLNIPVLPPSALIDTTRGWPDAILLSAWNFKDAILPKLKPLIDGGTHVIIPFPTVEVL